MPSSQKSGVVCFSTRPSFPCGKRERDTTKGVEGTGGPRSPPDDLLKGYPTFKRVYDLLNGTQPLFLRGSTLLEGLTETSRSRVNSSGRRTITRLGPTVQR